MFSILLIVYSSVETEQWFLSFTNVSRNFPGLKNASKKYVCLFIILNENINFLIGKWEMRNLNEKWEIWALTVVIAIYCSVLNDYKI